MQQLSETFSEWYSIISAFAIWLGGLNLMKISLEKIYKKESDWFFAIVTIISFLLILVVGLAAQQLGDSAPTDDKPGWL